MGDEIKEINGSPVQNQPVETLQRILVSSASESDVKMISLQSWHGIL